MSSKNCLKIIILNLYYFILCIQRGLFHEKRNEFNEAKQCYQNAVTVHPAHLKSLQHLVLINSNNKLQYLNVIFQNCIL